jgi:hypothetical protein
MKAKLIVFLVGTLLMASGAVAQDANLTDEELEQAQTFFNEYSEDLPGFLKTVIGDQRINANIESGNHTFTYSAETEGITVENVSRDRIDDPTLVVNTSESTIEDIAEANNSAQVTREKVNEGEITYESHGAFNKLKTFVMSLFF